MPTGTYFHRTCALLHAAAPVVAVAAADAAAVNGVEPAAASADPPGTTTASLAHADGHGLCVAFSQHIVCCMPRPVHAKSALVIRWLSAPEKGASAFARPASVCACPTLSYDAALVRLVLCCMHYLLWSRPLPLTPLMSTSSNQLPPQPRRQVLPSFTRACEWAWALRAH